MTQGDKPLWILGGVVVAVAVGFFAFLNMGAPESTTSMSTLNISTPDSSQTADQAEPAAATTDLSVRLNRARLAMDANMLLEPEGYSAWSIYAGILDDDAANAAAIDGLERVAARLIDQAFDALTAGRRADAAALAERVLARLPDHADAAQVRERAREVVVEENRAREAAPDLPDTPPTRTARAPAPTTPAPEQALAPQPEIAPVDPIVSIYSEFMLALSEDVLRGPSENNAADFLIAMRETDAEHAMTRDAEQQLLDAFFARHNAAFNRLDSETALEWLDDADTLGLQPERIAAAREQIYDFIAAEAATESIAAVQLEVRSYVPPDYPASALRRNLEGWVDVAFVLSRDGETMNVEAVDASSSIFRNAATSAVEQWQFEPRVVRERVVEQHAHTRIRFVLED